MYLRLLVFHLSIPTNSYIRTHLSNMWLISFTLLTSQFYMSTSRRVVQNQNMWLIYFTLLTSQFYTFTLISYSHIQNMWLIFFTLLVSKPDKSKLVRLKHSLNIYSIFVTLLVSKPEMSSYVSSSHPVNMLSILVTLLGCLNFTFSSLDCISQHKNLHQSLYLGHYLQKSLYSLYQPMLHCTHLRLLGVNLRLLQTKVFLSFLLVYQIL